jgi:hypothetical protein
VTLNAVPPVPAAGSFGAAVLDSDAYAYWRLNETASADSGVLRAYDYSGGGRHATYGAASLNGFNGIAGPRPADGINVFEPTNFALGTTANTADSWATTPPLGVTTDTLTIVAWIKPTTYVTNAGIVFARLGGAATGLGFGGAANLGYHWNDVAATYSWNSNLRAPLDQWSLVAIAVEPSMARAYLINTSGSQSATNVTAHATRAFTDQMRIGNDPNNVDRTFDGAIDEVAIFTRALSGAEIQGLFNGTASASPAKLTVSVANGQITVTWDQPGTLQSTTALAENPALTSWSNESTTGNTFTTPTSGTAKFFRVIQ